MPVITGIPGTGFKLDADALRWYLAMRADGMPSGGINSAYRSLAEQEALFFARYTRTHIQSSDVGTYGDVRWYDGARYIRTSPAGPVAVPGTSTHTEGRALDVATASTVHAWMVAHASAYGWKRTLWDAHELEPWHWEWHPSRITITDTPEDDMFTDEDAARLRGIVTILRRMETALSEVNTETDDLSWIKARIGGSISGDSVAAALAKTATRDDILAAVETAAARGGDPSQIAEATVALLANKLAN